MMARDIVRMRNQITKMNEFCGQLKAVSLRIGSISTINEFSNAMEEAANAIITVSGNLDTQKLAQMAKTMMKEDAKLDMRQEMMQEVLEGIGEGMDDPLQQDQIYKQILEELNINIEGEVYTYKYMLIISASYCQY